jgi:hypothetical protein
MRSPEGYRSSRASRPQLARMHAASEAYAAEWSFARVAREIRKVVMADARSRGQGLVATTSI